MPLNKRRHRSGITTSACSASLLREKERPSSERADAGGPHGKPSPLSPWDDYVSVRACLEGVDRRRGLPFHPHRPRPVDHVGSNMFSFTQEAGDNILLLWLVCGPAGAPLGWQRYPPVCVCGRLRICPGMDPDKPLIPLRSHLFTHKSVWHRVEGPFDLDMTVWMDGTGPYLEETEALLGQRL